MDPTAQPTTTEEPTTTAPATNTAPNHIGINNNRKRNRLLLHQQPPHQELQLLSLARIFLGNARKRAFGVMIVHTTQL